MDTREEMRRLNPVVELIADALAKADVPPEDAEKALLWIAGASYGLRQEPLDRALPWLALGWAEAANREPELD